MPRPGQNRVFVIVAALLVLGFLAALVGAVYRSGALGPGQDDRLTGDRGTLGVDGRLSVLGRLDDQLITGGVNVSPADVEAVVATLPGVRDVGVVGVPDPDWGQVVAALVASKTSWRTASTASSITRSWGAIRR